MRKPVASTILFLTALCACAAPALRAQEDPSGVADDPPGFKAPPIIVETSTKSEERLFDSPDAVSVVDREALKRSAPEDLGDSLFAQPGVSIQRTAAGQASPFIRGLTGKQVLLLVDGVRFNNSAFRFGPNQYFAVIDPLAVERMEIARGPFSVLYGSDALGGVINVITRKPAPAERRFIGTYTSANRGKRGAVDLPFVFDADLSGYGFYSVSQFEELRGGHGIGPQPFTDYRDWSGGGGLRWNTIGGSPWELDWRILHKTQFDVYRTDKNTTLVADPLSLPLIAGQRAASDALNIFPKQEDTFSWVNLSRKDFGGLRSFDANLSFHRVNEELNRITQGSTTLRDQYFNVNTVGLTLTAVADDLLLEGPLTFGLDVYHDTINSGRFDLNQTTGVKTRRDNRAQLPDDSRYLSLGVYAQQETPLIENLLSLRPGLRFSFFEAQAETGMFGGGLKDVDTGFADLTGAAALTLTPSENFSTTLSLARGFRAPNLDDLAAAKGTGAGEEIPNPDLKPEKLWAAQLGAKVLIENDVPEDAAPYRLSVSGAYFEHWLTDLMVRRNTTFGGAGVVQLANTGRARIWGWEIAARYYLGSELEALGFRPDAVFRRGETLALWGSASFSHGDDLSADEPLNRIPPLAAQFGLEYAIERGRYYLEPSVEIVDRQERYGSGAATDVRFQKPHTSGYTLYHLAAGWRLNESINVRLAARNLTDKNYQVLGSGVFGSGTDVRLTAEVRW